MTAHRARKVSVSGEKLGVASAENLLCAGLAVGLFVTSFRANAFGGSASYRNIGLAIAGCLIGAAILSGLTPPKRSQSRQRRNRDTLAVLAAMYFAWTGIQNFFLQSDRLGAATSVIAFLLVSATLATDLQRLNAGLRRWLLVIVVADFVPAFLGQGFEATKRVWLDFLPGRYFAFSNPNALAFIAGLAVLLAAPVLRQKRGRMLGLLGGTLVVLTAGYATAIGLGLALLAYLLLGRLKSTGLLSSAVAALALVTPALVIWLPSDDGVGVLSALQENLDLSNRSFLWVSLVRLTRDSGNFWLGLGDQRVAFYTAAIQDVGTAHSTILQLYLSEGFITTVFFVFVAALATRRILNSERTRDARVAFAVVVYWFVVSLSSAEPGTALGFSLIVILAVARSSAPHQSLDQHGTPKRGAAGATDKEAGHHRVHAVAPLQPTAPIGERGARFKTLPFGAASRWDGHVAPGRDLPAAALVDEEV